MINGIHRVILTGDAQLNFEAIKQHLIHNGVSKRLAINNVIDLVHQVKSLDILPNRYQSIKERYNIEIDTRYRVMPISNYVALYKIDEKNSIVYVQRVINQKENIKEYIINNFNG